MNRRNALQSLGSAIGVTALAGFSQKRLLAIGRELNGRERSPAPQDLLVLDEHQNRTVTLIAEHIIPETDTPGARAARVNEFIDVMLAEWFDDDEREEFLRGLANVDTRSLNLFGSVFVQASEAEQVAILRGLDAELTALREARVPSQNHFFSRMKWLTMYGYYTSEIGQVQELQVAIVPGRFDPCGPVRRDASEGW